MSVHFKVYSGVLALLFASAVTPPSVEAVESKNLARAPQQNEQTALSALVEQILNSIDKSSLDIEFEGLRIQSQEGKESRLDLDYGSLSGLIQFNRDWRVDLIPADPDSKADSQITRLYPQLGADAKNLVAAVSIQMQGEKIETSLKFYSGFDSKTQTWAPRPLTLQVSNQMNKSLLSLRLHSLHAQVKPNAVNPGQKEVTGTCVSDKMLLDLTSGKNKLVKVACEFTGTLTEKGYQLQFKYMNRK